jgi:hypothetical protein
MAALDGTGVCSAVVAGCTETGCGFDVQVNVDAGCLVPISETGGSGLILVHGIKTGPESASLIAQFGGLDLGEDDDWFVASIGSMVATRSGDQVTVVYAQQQVSVTSGAEGNSTELSQHVWTATADTEGTLEDTTDDTYTISGGIQDAEAGTEGAFASQAAIGAAVITPECRRNPTAGSAHSQRVGAGSSVVLSMLSIGFHPECDGRADITSAIGTDMFAIGGTVHMDLEYD